MRRTRPPLKLRNGPLALVLAQIRISSVLQMRTYVPEIQEILRRKGFPRYAESQVQEIILGPASTPAVNVESKWVFSDRELKSAVVVANGFISLETTAYDTFDVFADQMREVLEVVGGVAGIDLAERLGLRYLDYVRPLGDDRLADYLYPGIAGIKPADGLSELAARVLVQGSTPVGKFIFRVTHGRGSFALPPDLQPPDLDMSAFPEAEEWAILDIDHFSTAARDYHPDALIDGLWDLHDVVDGLFRDAATPHAFQRWGVEERGPAQ